MTTEARTIERAFTRAVAAAPDLKWLRFLDGDTYTLAQLDTRVRRVAAGLQHLGIHKGDRVAIMAGNTIEFVETWLATHLIGAIAVPINTAMRGDVLAHMLRLAEPAVVVVEHRYLSRSTDAARQSGVSIRITVTFGAECGATMIPGNVSYAALPVDEPPEPVELSERDPSSIMYTSGTTGPSKGVVWTQGATWHMADIPGRAMRYGQNDVLYICLPLFHASALTNLLVTGLLNRARIAVADRFSVSGFWRDIHDSRATATNILGAMMPLLLGRDPDPLERGHQLRKAMVVPAPPGTAAAMRERFGIESVHPYGLSDFGWITWPDLGENVEDGSVGTVHGSYEAKLVDSDDREVPVGALGEMVARPRSPWTTPIGYWRMPEETLESTRNMWFHTGDLMRQDERGNFFFVDRAKDAIRRRGENVPSFEVEQAVAQHPAVEECAAYAIGSELTEDEIAVAVVLRNGISVPAPEETIRFVAMRLPYFAVPRFVRIVPELPKTQTEKVQKHLLRLDGITADTWDRETSEVEIPR